MMTTLTTDDIRHLLQHFASNGFREKDPEKRSEAVQNHCIQLFSKDNQPLIIIDNESGEMSNTYPLKIIIPQVTSNPLNTTTTSPNGILSTIKPHGYLDPTKLRELMTKARVARCRARFPVPVIKYMDRYVCRSSTLSGVAEIYGRSARHWFFTAAGSQDDVEADNEIGVTSTSLSALNVSENFSKVRNQDISLLKYMSVKYICDLMVENKKVKFGVNVTSSEKADKESRYSEFDILSLPYPGCEFFKEYRDNSYNGEGLIYNWEQNFVDADLLIPDDPISSKLDVQWNNYKQWDILKLTTNYLKLLLRYLCESNESVLIHCISGWDRTPLFVSLLRLSLWADGKIHQDLSPIEITYLTLAYDWYLFGHNLNDRINKGEEILFFCFYFLKYLASKEFSVDYLLANELKQPEIELLKKTDCEQLKQSSYPPSDNFCLESLLLEDNHYKVQDSINYGGSCTSLNSNCSSVSSKSQEPPNSFPCNEGYFNLSPCKKTSSTGEHRRQLSPLATDGYPRTPPTLTNSEEGSDFLKTNSASPEMKSHSPSDKISQICNSKDEVDCKARSNCQKSCEGKPVRKTNPVAIPTTKKSTSATASLSSCSSLNNKEMRMKNDKRSSSAFLVRSDSSWQIVSETGSIRDSTSNKSFYSSPDSPELCIPPLAATTSNGHNHLKETDLKSEEFESKFDNIETKPSLTESSKSIEDNTFSKRKEKLRSVRSLFYNAYSSAIGFRFKNGGAPEPTGLSMLLDTFAGTVHNTTTRIVAPH